MKSNNSQFRPYFTHKALFVCLFLCGLLAVFRVTAGQAKAPNSNGDRPNDVAERKLRTSWQKRSDHEANEITRRHLHGLVRAAHRYHEQHGTFPPAVLPNDELPAGKRLSGLVLLLPHLDADSWIEAGKPCFDRETVHMARKLYEKIDLTKAWDDPVNLEAARTIVPAFVGPTFGPLRNSEGYALTHFAFVQGGADGLDGAFPGDTSVGLSDIKDGTSNTLAMGQIIDNLGPWIAEGQSTARQLHPPVDGQPGTFGSRYKSGAFFALCDSSTFFVLLNKTADENLRALCTIQGGEIIASEEVVRVTNPVELSQ